MCRICVEAKGKMKEGTDNDGRSKRILLLIIGFIFVGSTESQSNSMRIGEGRK